MPCSRNAHVHSSPNMDLLWTPQTGLPRPPPWPLCSAWKSLSVCVSIAAVITAEPFMELTSNACNVSTSGARSAPATPKRSFLPRKRKRRRTRRSQGRRGCQRSRQDEGVNWHISHQSNESSAPATSARHYSSLRRLPSVSSVVTYDAPNAHVTRQSYKSGLKATLGTWTRTATPKSRNSWRSSGALGGSRARESDGSASSAILPLSAARHNVRDAAMSGVRSALDHRMFSPDKFLH